MGLFDYVVCECPLPDAGAADVDEWQTKDFEPYMERYRITAEGRLLKERVHYEDRSDPNAVGLMRFAGMMTRVHEGWDDINYEGSLNFYGFGLQREWFEYDAIFRGGTLVTMDRVVLGHPEEGKPT